jgi:hypothetical protein
MRMRRARATSSRIGATASQSAAIMRGDAAVVSGGGDPRAMTVDADRLSPEQKRGRRGRTAPPQVGRATYVARDFGEETGHR